MLNVLELFKGGGSINRYCATKPDVYKVLSLDIEPKWGADITMSILDWDYKQYPVGYFDIVWASPPCVEYSILMYGLMKRFNRQRDLEGADALVKKALEIIAYFKPKVWYLENPKTGMLKDRPFMEGLPYYDVSYCKYGYDYRKHTRIWTNVEGFEPQVCKKDCGKMVGDRHKKNLGKSSQGGMVNNLKDRYSIPQPLIRDLFESARLLG
jgi:hypothetical protein